MTQQILNASTERNKHLVRCGVANSINSTINSHLDSDSGVKALHDTPQNKVPLQESAHKNMKTRKERKQNWESHTASF